MARPKRRAGPVKKSSKSGAFYEQGDKYAVQAANANRRRDKAKKEPLAVPHKDATQKRTECKKVLQKACKATKGHRDNDRRRGYAGKGWLGFDKSVKKCRKFFATKEKPIVACKPVKRKKSNLYQSDVIEYKGYTLKKKRRKGA